MRKNTAGPVCESTWPAITAGPRSPGRGPPVHQPASPKSVGTSSVRSGLRPRPMTGASTPIDGISIRTGSRRARGARGAARGAATATPSTPHRERGVGRRVVAAA